jgi:hypothetical protein
MVISFLSVAAKRVHCLNNRKRKAEHSFSITEEQIWAIREVKIRGKGSNRRRPSSLKRKNEN